MENFSRYISEKLIPNPNITPREKSSNSFAVILEDGQSISIQDVCKIKERTSLSPLFFVISPTRTLDISRRYSRILDGRLALAKSYSSAVELLSNLSFTVCESLFGSYVSFFAGTPTYICDNSPLSRTFIREVSVCSLPEDIFIPFQKNKTEKIRRVDTNAASFALARKKLRTDFGTKLSSILF